MDIFHNRLLYDRMCIVATGSKQRYQCRGQVLVELEFHGAPVGTTRSRVG